MARQPRIDFPGAVHHVMNRGADHQIIFRNDADRRLFLALWAQAVVRFGIVVISYCLMGNHYHLLVLSPNGQLSRSLQFVARSYTQQFNHHHGRDGALFRGRFRSILVDSDVYLGRVARYIELNPVAAGIIPIQSLQEYQWSSFRYHVGFEEAPTWLSSEVLLENYATPRRFDRFVRSGMKDDQLDRFYRRLAGASAVLGSQRFVEQVELDNEEIRGWLTAGIPPISLDEIDSAIIHLSGIDRMSLRSSVRGKRNVQRAVAAQLGQLLSHSSMAELAERYVFPTEQAVSNVISRARYHPETERLRHAVLHTLGRLDDGTPMNG